VSWAKHVAAARVLKRELETLNGLLLPVREQTRVVHRAALKVIGKQPSDTEIEPARMIRLWTADNVNTVQALIQGVDHINEKVDAFLRRL
jgi:hypothetical protein